MRFKIYKKLVKKSFSGKWKTDLQFGKAILMKSLKVVYLPKYEIFLNSFCPWKFDAHGSFMEDTFLCRGNRASIRCLWKNVNFDVIFPGYLRLFINEVYSKVTVKFLRI